MNYSDDIDFLYLLDAHGWSSCLISVDGRLYEMRLTHVFENPIEELLINMTMLLKGADETSFTLHDEPGEYKWSIKRNKEQKHKVSISITECVQINTFASPELELLQFEVKLKLFSICILHQMQKIHDLMMEPSYKDYRKGQFPFKVFNEYKSVHEHAFPHLKKNQDTPEQQ